MAIFDGFMNKYFVFFAVLISHVVYGADTTFLAIDARSGSLCGRRGRTLTSV